MKINTPSLLIVVGMLASGCSKHESNAAAQSAPPIPEATKYVSTTYGFACAFPGKVEESQLAKSDGVNNADFHLIFSFSSDSTWAGMVGVAQYTGNTADQYTSLRQFLDGMQNGTGITITDTTRTSHWQHPAMTFNYSMSGQVGLITGHGYVMQIDQSRAYLVGAMATSVADHSNIDPFIDSFELLK